MLTIQRLGPLGQTVIYDTTHHSLLTDQGQLLDNKEWLQSITQFSTNKKHTDFYLTDHIRRTTINVLNSFNCYVELHNAIIFLLLNMILLPSKVVMFYDVQTTNLTLLATFEIDSKQI